MEIAGGVLVAAGNCGVVAGGVVRAASNCRLAAAECVANPDIQPRRLHVTGHYQAAVDCLLGRPGVGVAEVQAQIHRTAVTGQGEVVIQVV